MFNLLRLIKKRRLNVKLNFKFGKKAGFLAEAFSDIWIFIIFVLVALIFVFLTAISKNSIKQEIGSDAGKIALESYFFHYLQTPVNMDDKGWVMTPLGIAANVDIENKDNFYTKKISETSENFLKTFDVKVLPKNICYIKIFVASIDDTDKKIQSGNWENPLISCNSDNGIEVFPIEMQAPSPIGSNINQKIIMELHLGSKDHPTVTN